MSIKLLVLSTVLMLLITACGGGTAATPTPDIEATLVAKVVATIVAISSLTSVPADTPTATPTSVPAVTPLPAQPFVVDNEATAEALRGTPTPTPIEAEEVFVDIFRNATKVDRVSLDDINNCRVVSTFDLAVGDRASVEVALARKEDGRSPTFSFRPMFVVIRDTSGNDVLGDVAYPELYRFGLQRTINNAWNEANTGPYAIAVYRGKVNMVPGSTGTADNAPKKDKAPKDKGLADKGPASIYEVRFVENETSSAECMNLLINIDVTNLVPDSVLIAWYVN
jgi:hypothetical protein